MTLHTQILTHQPVDVKELFTWVNEHLLRAPHAKFREVENGFWNEMEQGLDALMWVVADPKGGEHKEWWQEDGEWANLDEDEREYYSERFTPKGYTMLHLDTAYGYDPAITHARMIAQLDAQFFVPRGITFAWYNEFEGEWHEGNDGLLEFAGPQGFGAESWFKQTVKPAFKQAGIVWEDDERDDLGFFIER